VASGGCLGAPPGVEPVRGFEVERYLGRWYEIARLDHRFERGLEAVTAEYTLRSDIEIGVRNRGFDPEAGEWKEAEGRARFVYDSDIGHLKVSFFGPFYASYVIFELDGNYGWAFVSGYDLSYLWLLARSPVVDDELRQAFVARAREIGFDVDGLIWVDQSRNEGD
jgi:apolipoprotein D and lipocalin family protein